ncbi:hypothetical protein BH23VER1_BH23VER1_25830 [soil metagenome]
MGMTLAGSPLPAMGQAMGGFGGESISPIPPDYPIDNLSTEPMPVEELMEIVRGSADGDGGVGEGGLKGFPNIVVDEGARGIEVPALRVQRVELADLMETLKLLVGIRYAWIDSGTQLGVLLIQAPAPQDLPTANPFGMGGALGGEDGYSEPFDSFQEPVEDADAHMGGEGSPSDPFGQTALGKPTVAPPLAPGHPRSSSPPQSGSRVLSLPHASAGSGIYPFAPPPKADPPEPMVRVFAIGHLPVDSEAIMDVVKEIWMVAEPGWSERADGPKMSYHTGTGVLIVKGTEKRLKEVEQIVAELDKAGPAGDDEAAGR